MNSNPWKAFLPYDEGSAAQFKGRTKNVDELFSAIKKERTTICYADSGVGKSSLINAGLKPKLRQHLFFPVDIIFTEADFAQESIDFDKRIIKELNIALSKLNEQNLEVQFEWKTLIDISDERAARLDMEMKEASLWWMLHTRVISCSINGNQVADYAPIFIFDQFEELFTRSRYEGLVHSFFEWFPSVSADAVPESIEKAVRSMDDWTFLTDVDYDARMKFLFSLRQDSMGTFDYWASQRFSIPSLRTNRYCLLPLTTEQAYSVITKQGVDTLNVVAEDIIKELKEKNNDSVPAIMLSVFCSQLYEKAKTGDDGQKLPIMKEEVMANKENLIREYYEELLKKTGIDEKIIFVIEDCLVSETGKRNRIVKGSNDLLNAIHFDEQFKGKLSSCYLINDRDEYVEIAHDKVAEAIFVRKKERKLKLNLRRWRLLAFLIPFFLLIFSELYMVIPSSGVYLSSHEFVLDDDEYFNPFDINGKEVYWNTVLSKNNSLLENVMIDTFHICWKDFSNCSNLQRVKVEKVEKVGKGKLNFTNCPNLEHIDLADCVTHIDEKFVVDCPNLRTFKISKQVKDIDQWAFMVDDISFEVDSLNEHFVWENGILWNKQSYSTPIVYIQKELLRETNRIPFLYQCKYEDSLRYRDMYVYPLDLYKAEVLTNSDSTELLPSPIYKFYKSIDLSRFTKVNEVPDGMFAECEDLESIVLPPFVRKIGAEAFRSCTELKRVIFPSSLNEIGAHAFEDCYSLGHIEFNREPFFSVSISDYAFSSCLSLKTLELPQKISSLGMYAFADCEKLEKVTFPISVKKYSVFYENAFTRCYCLESFELRDIKRDIDENMHNLRIMDGCVFKNQGKFLYGPNKTYSYKDEHYYSKDGILYDNTTKSIVAWNEYSQLDKHFHSDFFLYKYRNSNQSEVVLFKDLDKKCIHLPRYSGNPVYYSFWKLPLNLQELHISFPQPDALSLYLRKTNDKHIVPTTIRIRLPLHIRENVVLHVPYGCSKYYRNHPDYQGFKSIEEDSMWMRMWDEMDYMFDNIVSYYSAYWWLTLLSIMGIITLCGIVFALGRSIDQVLGVNRSDKRALISAIVFTMFLAPVSFMGAYWFTFNLFLRNAVICTLVAIVFCILSVIVLSIMQRMTPKELWKKRKEIGQYLYKFIQTIWIKWHMAKVLLITFVLFLALWGFNDYSKKYFAYIEKGIDTTTEYINRGKPFRAISYAYEKDLPMPMVGITNVLKHTYGVRSASFSPDGKRIVTASGDKTAIIWDAMTGEVLDTLKGHTHGVLSASFSSDGKRIVTASKDETAMVWDAITGEALDTLKGHTHGVLSASFSPDGKRIVTVSEDETAMIWDAMTCELLDTLKGHTYGVLSASFSPDGKRIVTASKDETAMVLDAMTSEVLDTLKGHTDWVWSASFSPDGKRIVTASGDKTAIIWDAMTGEVLNTLKGHTYGVLSASFSPDGKRIVTASKDETAMVWDTMTGQVLDMLKGHTDWELSANFSPDGKRIVTASGDKTAIIWDIDLLLDKDKWYDYAKEISKKYPLSEEETAEVGFDYAKWAIPFLLIEIIVVACLCYMIVRMELFNPFQRLPHKHWRIIGLTIIVLIAIVGIIWFSKEYAQ